MGSSVHWTINEIHTLFEMRKQGIDFSVIGKNLADLPEHAAKHMKNIAKFIPIFPRKKGRKTHIRAHDTACVGYAKKPVLAAKSR